MITIKKLKEELNKFSDEDLCYAYEGEVIGLIIETAGERLKNQGVIHCSEGNDEGKETTHYGMKEPNKVEGFNSFAIETRDFTFPVDKSEYLYTKEDLKKAFTEGFNARYKMLNGTASRENFIKNYEPNQHIEHVNSHIEKLDEKIENFKQEVLAERNIMDRFIQNAKNK